MSAFVTGSSSSIFIHGADPVCTCGHINRRHRWCAPYRCVDCECVDYVQPVAVRETRGTGEAAP